LFTPFACLQAESITAFFNLAGSKVNDTISVKETGVPDWEFTDKKHWRIELSPVRQTPGSVCLQLNMEHSTGSRVSLLRTVESGLIIQGKAQKPEAAECRSFNHLGKMPWLGFNVYAVTSQLSPTIKANYDDISVASIADVRWSLLSSNNEVLGGFGIPGFSQSYWGTDVKSSKAVALYLVDESIASTPSLRMQGENLSKIDLSNFDVTKLPEGESREIDVTINWKTGESSRKLFLQVLDSLSTPQSGQYCVRPVYQQRNGFSSIVKSGDNWVVSSAIQTAEQLRASLANHCSIKDELVFTVVVNAAQHSVKNKSSRLLISGGNSKQLQLSSAMIKLVDLAKGVKPYAVLESGSNWVSDNTGGYSVVLEGAGATQLSSASTLSTSQPAAKAQTSDSLKLAPQIFFGSYARPLTACVAELSIEGAVKTRSALRRGFQVFEGAEIPADAWSVPEAWRVSFGRTKRGDECPAGHMNEFTLSELIELQTLTDEPLPLELSSDKILFVGYLPFLRWIETVDFFNKVYEKGRNGENAWVDGVIYGPTKNSDEVAVVLEPKSNFVRSLDGGAGLETITEQMFERAQALSSIQSFSEDQLIALHAELGDAKINLLYFDDIATSCEDYAEEIARSKLNVVNAVIIAASDEYGGKRFPRGESRALRGNLVDECASEENLRVYVFNSREVNTNKVWDGALDTIFEDLSQ